MEGSGLFQVHLGTGGDSGSLATGRASGDPASAAASKAQAAAFHLGLLVAGYFTAPRGMGALMTPLTEADVDGFVRAAVEAAGDALESSTRP